MIKCGIVVQQLDGTWIPLSACTCQQPWIEGYEYGSVFCPIDRHAQRARQATWAFDDEGRVYASTEETD